MRWKDCWARASFSWTTRLRLREINLSHQTPGTFMLSITPIRVSTITLTVTLLTGMRQMSCWHTMTWVSLRSFLSISLRHTFFTLVWVTLNSLTTHSFFHEQNCDLLSNSVKILCVRVWRLDVALELGLSWQEVDVGLHSQPTVNPLSLFDALLMENVQVLVTDLQPLNPLLPQPVVTESAW